MVIYSTENKLNKDIGKEELIMEEGKEALRFKQLRLKKIRLPFDTGYLDIIIAFIYKESVLRTRKVLQNIAKLFDIIDDSIYADKPQVEDRIWIIRNSLNAIIKEGFESAENIKSYLFDQIECDESKTKIISNINQETYKISYEESKYLIKQIEDRLQFGYSITIKEEMQKLFDRIDVGDFKSYKSVMEDIYDLSVSILNGRRAISSLDSDQTFSLRDEYFEDVITESVNNLKDKDKMFVTGIKWWNVILAPAYLSKRLYTYLAFPGGGKSQILLKSALDIKKYNAHVKPKDPNHIPTILYITMENDIDETIERVFNMTCSSDDIRNYTPKQVAKKLRKEGQLAITNDNSIDILIKYYPNRSIDTNDLYTIIKDMEDNGSECIALILDYLKRIRPAEKGANEKEELKNITNELKTLAKTLDIPVITAQQLNRAAASVVDAAIQSKKEDLIKLIGRDGVSGAWEINTMVSPYSNIWKNNYFNCWNFCKRQSASICNVSSSTIERVA